MSYSEPARTAGRRRRSTILAATLVVVTAVLIGVLGYPSLATLSSSATSAEPIALRPQDSLRRSSGCTWRGRRCTARKRKQPDGSPPRAPLLTKRETRSTSDTPIPRRGYPNTVPGTRCARSTATNPGTTSYGPTPSITVARLCTPTPRRIQGCSDDQHAQHRTGVNTTRGRQAEEKTTAGGRPCHDRPDRRAVLTHPPRPAPAAAAATRTPPTMPRR